MARLQQKTGDVRLSSSVIDQNNKLAEDTNKSFIELVGAYTDFPSSFPIPVSKTNKTDKEILIFIQDTSDKRDIAKCGDF